MLSGRRWLAVVLCFTVVYGAAGVANSADNPNGNFRVWNLSDYVRETGKVIREFREAPELARLVAAGRLPPVNERLPEEPLVVQPVEVIGKYGGTAKGMGMNPASFGNSFWTPRVQAGLTIYPDWQTIGPGVFRSYRLSDDLKSLTVYLRPGMKWSDGQPFTAEDVVFWSQDIVGNRELNPVPPAWWTVNGQPIVAVKLDDYTVQFRFAAPYPAILELLTRIYPYAPKHYLQQFHAAYNPDADKIAKAKGYEHWYQYFNYVWKDTDGHVDPNLPTVDPWVFAGEDRYGNKYYRRNPYYWKVDTAGNQLPYIDEMVRLYVPEREQVLLKIMGGEIHFEASRLQLVDVPVLREHEAAGGYKTVLLRGVFGSERRFLFNLTTPDPVLRRVFNDIRFRQAMSMAINREEINRTLFFGLGAPRQYTAPSTTAFYEDWMGKYYAQYDPAQANRLLDEMGLKWDRQRQQRLLPDGRPLEFELLNASGATELVEMVVDYWSKVGVKAKLVTVSRELLVQRGQANQIQAVVWFGDAVDEFYMRQAPELIFGPPWSLDQLSLSGRPWRLWELTNGQAGEEPPEEIRQLQALKRRWLNTIRGSEEYRQLGKDLLGLSVRGLYAIGTVGETPQVFAVSKSLRNVPTGMVWVDHLRGSQGDQWFWESTP